jgi:type IV pilus assembly protein PilE
VLVVVAILGALAAPTYQRHLLRVNRIEGVAALQQLLAAQERFYLRHGRYTADASSPPPAGLGLNVTTGRYLLAISLAADGQTFIATASPSPAGGQSRDQECLAFSMDQRGRRAISGSGAVENCWR